MFCPYLGDLEQPRMDIVVDRADAGASAAGLFPHTEYMGDADGRTLIPRPNAHAPPSSSSIPCPRPRKPGHEARSGPHSPGPGVKLSATTIRGASRPSATRMSGICFRTEGVLSWTTVRHFLHAEAATELFVPASLPTSQRVILLNLRSFWCSCFMPSEELPHGSRAASMVLPTGR